MRMLDKRNIPIIILGLSYIGVSGVRLFQILTANVFDPHFIIPGILWILLGIALIFRNKIAILLSVSLYPSIFAVEILSPQLLKEIDSYIPFFYTPFHYISFIILQKYALLSIVKPYWPFYVWGVYAIHSVCLLPYLKIPVDEEDWWDFRLFYESNPFRLSCCPINAPTPEMRSILGELETGRRTEVIPLGFNEGDPTQQDINDAHGRLKLTETRIKEEILWFWIRDDNKDDLRRLRTGDWSDLRKKWEIGKKKGDSVSLHNLAVYWHIQAITEERKEIKLNKRKELSSDCIATWQKALKYWRDAYNDKNFWDYVKERTREIGDPGYRVHRVDSLKDKWYPLEEILKINGDIVRKAFESDKHRYKKYIIQHINLITKSGFPDGVVIKILGNMLDILGFAFDLESRINNILASAKDGDIEHAERMVKELSKVLREINEINERLPEIYSSGRIESILDKINDICRKRGIECIEEGNEKMEIVTKALVTSFRRKEAIRLLKDVAEYFEEAIKRFDRIISICTGIERDCPSGVSSLNEIRKCKEWAETNKDMAQKHLLEIREVLY